MAFTRQLVQPSAVCGRNQFHEQEEAEAAEKVRKLASARRGTLLSPRSPVQEFAQAEKTCIVCSTDLLCFVMK